jgi:hypothetical protein
MKHRKLGNTGLIVSEVALGTMQFGGKMNMGNLGQEETTRMVKLALDRGINFIDTADVYSLGESETLVGNAFKGVRTEIVLATKAAPHERQSQSERCDAGEHHARSGGPVSNGCRPTTSTSTRCMDGTATRPLRRQYGHLTMSCARGRSAISGSPTTCHGRRPPQ